jgi:cation:H+ antiporter
VSSLPIWANAVAFAGAAAAIWWAGVRVERIADELAKRTGMGQAFVGMLLLATATSLPEVATTVTAVVVLGDPTLAVYNLLGGIAFQTLLLVAADLAQRERGALTFFTPRFALLVQGIALALLLQVAIAGLAARGEPQVLSVSVWTVLIVVVHMGALHLTRRGVPRWTPTEADDVPADRSGAEEERPRRTRRADERGERAPFRTLWLRFAALSLVVLAGGWVAAGAADALADQTGLGAAFLGATLLAAATSLPELSTTIAASRAGSYPLAISNVFGSNSFDVSLLLVADVLYRDGTILAHVEGPVVFVAALAGTMTCVYVLGLVERRDRTVLGVGWDSAAATVVYAGGMVVLWLLQ